MWNFKHFYMIFNERVEMNKNSIIEVIQDLKK